MRMKCNKYACLDCHIYRNYDVDRLERQLTQYYNELYHPNVRGADKHDWKIVIVLIHVIKWRLDYHAK